MYSEILDYLKKHLESQITAAQIQSGYLGDFAEINLAIPAVLMELKKDSQAAKSTRWKDGSIRLKLWVMIEISRDFLSSMKEMEHLLGAEDHAAEVLGVKAALDLLKRDMTFSELTGSMGGKKWRIASRVLDHSDVDFGINQRGSAKINTAQVDLVIYTEVER